MKVLLVNGSPHRKGETYHALSLVEKALHEKGIATEWFWVGNKPVRGCRLFPLGGEQGVSVERERKMGSPKLFARLKQAVYSA